MKDRFGDDIKPGERAQISLLPGPYPYSGFGWACPGPGTVQLPV
jgi:hypothetical protein